MVQIVALWCASGQKVNNTTLEINGRNARVHLAFGTSATVAYCDNGLLFGIGG